MNIQLQLSKIIEISLIKIHCTYVHSVNFKIAYTDFSTLHRSYVLADTRAPTTNPLKVLGFCEHTMPPYNRPHLHTSPSYVLKSAPRQFSICLSRVSKSM